MKYFYFSISFITLIFTSCGSDSDSAANSASITSATTPATLPSGLQLAVNPIITFSAEVTDGGTVTVRYVNTDPTNYPVFDGNLDLNMSMSGTIINLAFSVGGKIISLNLDGFKDRGGDGHTDEFTVAATIDGTSLPSETGQFIGNVKPINDNIKEADRVDITGIPTESQFQNNIVGFAILAETPSASEKAIVWFEDQTKVSHLDEYGIISGTYKYSYNNGKPTLAADVNGPGITVKTNMDLTFNGFYEGTWSETEYTENGKSSTPQELDSGRFVVLSGTSKEDLENFLK